MKKNKNLPIVLGMLALISGITAVYLSKNDPSPIPTPSPDNFQISCEKMGATWLAEFNECESPSAETKLFQSECAKLGGKYFDCASPCRHDSKAEACISLCMKVCKF